MVRLQKGFLTSLFRRWFSTKKAPWCYDHHLGILLTKIPWSAFCALVFGVCWCFFWGVSCTSIPTGPTTTTTSGTTTTMTSYYCYCCYVFLLLTTSTSAPTATAGTSITSATATTITALGLTAVARHSRPGGQLKQLHERPSSYFGEANLRQTQPVNIPGR